MIVPNLEYHQGVCAWLDGKSWAENPYQKPDVYALADSWLDGWSYANYYYGELNYGKV